MMGRKQGCTHLYDITYVFLVFMCVCYQTIVTMYLIHVQMTEFIIFNSNQCIDKGMYLMSEGHLHPHTPHPTPPHPTRTTLPTGHLPPGHSPIPIFFIIWGIWGIGEMSGEKFLEPYLICIWLYISTTTAITNSKCFIGLLYGLIVKQIINIYLIQIEFVLLEFQQEAYMLHKLWCLPYLKQYQDSLQ